MERHRLWFGLTFLGGIGTVAAFALPSAAALGGIPAMIAVGAVAVIVGPLIAIAARKICLPNP